MNFAARMSAMDTLRSAYRSAGLEFDGSTGEVRSQDGICLRLSPINMAVLASLVERRGEVVSRAVLFDRVWPKQDVSDDVLTRVISDLRQKLKAEFGPRTFIETLPKRGYRWVPEVCSPEVDSPPGANGIDGSTAESASASPSRPRWRASLLRLVVYLALAFFLASALVWVIDFRTTAAHSRVAIFPTDNAGPADALSNQLDELIAAELLKLERLELLSHSAIASRLQEPFPYVHTRLGADWVVESRLGASETGPFLFTISVVDARTGIVSVARSMEVDEDRASLAGGVRRLVSEIRPYLESAAGP